MVIHLVTKIRVSVKTAIGVLTRGDRKSRGPFIVLNQTIPPGEELAFRSPDFIPLAFQDAGQFTITSQTDFILTKRRDKKIQKLP